MESAVPDEKRNPQDRPEPSPKRAAQQNKPEPERPVRPDEDAGVSIPELENPPQAEGQR